MMMTPQEYADKHNVYVAKDSNGEWHCFNNEPVQYQEINIWISTTSGFKKPVLEKMLVYNADWMDTLTRPMTWHLSETIPTHPKSEQYRPGQLILCWNPDYPGKYAQVRHFIAYHNNGVYVVNIYNNNCKRVFFKNHRSFDQQLAETKIRHWPRGFLDKRCETCGRDY